jgi:hypothetical protein
MSRLVTGLLFADAALLGASVVLVGQQGHDTFVYAGAWLALWCGVALLAGLVVGAVVRRRDEQKPRYSADLLDEIQREQVRRTRRDVMDLELEALIDATREERES